MRSLCSAFFYTFVHNSYIHFPRISYLFPFKFSIILEDEFSSFFFALSFLSSYSCLKGIFHVTSMRIKYLKNLVPAEYFIT
jgi:hypothetical protein